MNSNIIICTHGETGKELLKSVEMIMGKQEDVYPICFFSNENTDDIIKKYKIVLDESKNKNNLILVDLFGGSPFNAAVSLALDEENIEVVTGVNIPMLLEVFSLSNRDSLSKLVDTALDAGKKGVQKLELDD